MRQATIHLSAENFEALGLGNLVSTFQAAGLIQVKELQCQRPGCLLALTVAEPLADEELSCLPDLEWWERLGNDEPVTYLCKIAVPAFEDGLDPYPETGVSQDRIDVTGDGIEVTMVGSHEALSERVRAYGDTGADVLVRALTDYEGPAGDPLDALTARQYEVLTTAYDLGYFEVPREATTAEVAEVLDLDSSTVREHLQRAQRNLLTSLLTG